MSKVDWVKKTWYYWYCPTCKLRHDIHDSPSSVEELVCPVCDGRFKPGKESVGEGKWVNSLG